MSDKKDKKDEKKYEIIGKWHLQDNYWQEIFKQIDFKNILQSEDPLEWKNLQYMSGFDLPDFITYTYINPKSVFDRLCYFLNHKNIIAVSELKKDQGRENLIKQILKEYNEYIKESTDKQEELDPNKVLKFLNDINFLIKQEDTSAKYFLETKFKNLDPSQINGTPIIYGCNEDTGFITTWENTINTDSFSDSDLFLFKDLKILNIHFSSSGPNGEYLLKRDGNTLTKSSNSKDKKISLYIDEFIKYEFEIQGKIRKQDLKSVNIICGDTNITQKKSEIMYPDITRDELGQEIARGLNKFFKTEENNQEWLVLMSSYKIIKNRQGFILRNQQLGKTVSEGNKDIIGEADGTILAIKIFSDRENKKEIITRWKEHFTSHYKNLISKYYVIYCKEGIHKVIDKQSFLEKRVAVGQTEQLVAAGRTEQRVAAGQTEQRVAAGQTEQLVAAGQTEHRVVTGRIEQRVPAGRTEQRITPLNLEYFKKYHAYNFLTSPEKSMYDFNVPKEKIFLDHSVLYTGLEFLNIHINKNIDTTTFMCFNYKQPIQQLIVLNLNSMINTSKSWNLNARNHLDNIKLLDEALFNIMKTQILIEDRTQYNPSLEYKDGKQYEPTLEYKKGKQYKPTLEYKDFHGKIGKKLDEDLYFKIKLTDEALILLNGLVIKEFTKIRDTIIKTNEQKKIKDQNIEKEKIALNAIQADLDTEDLDTEDKDKSKPLENKYYKKYIKYKTKYHHLKNT
jgi:hypothetical protein